MARKVFFSFQFGNDAWRCSVVRNSGVTQRLESAGFIDKVGFETIERQGDAAIRNWINNEMKGTTVTVLLIGAMTHTSKWVEYEINRTRELGHGLVTIDVCRIKDSNGMICISSGYRVDGYTKYDWVLDDGYSNLGKWVEDAARAAGIVSPNIKPFIL